MLWDIFCKVIDNHGDIGVCWRLSAQLAGRGQKVRLWVDDASALTWMAPHGALGVEVLPWQAQAIASAPGDVVIEAFGCELEPVFQRALAANTRASGRQPVWINLEYLTAEGFAERNHGLPSPVLAGPAAGLTKHFFYPGFTSRTGGLLREDGLLSRQAEFEPAAWLEAQGVVAGTGERLVSLFCYEPPTLAALLSQLAAGPQTTRLLVTAGRAANAVRAAVKGLDQSRPGWAGSRALSFTWLPLLSQSDFDHLLWSCDFNLVRGEDSLVRALWAAKPMAWQAYPQQDGAHHAKLDAFLDWARAPAPMREFHRAWNGSASDLPPVDPACWARAILDAKQRLLEQPDLATQLMRYVKESAGQPDRP